MKGRGAYEQPESPCPYCGATCEADWVDVGVGVVQCGPYHCFDCGASEIGPERAEDGFEATDEEKKTGWYRSRVSPLANTCQGIPVDHKTAKQLYVRGLLDEKVLPSTYEAERIEGEK